MSGFLSNYGKGWVAASLAAALSFWIAGGVMLMLIASILIAVFLRGAATAIAHRLALPPAVCVVVVVVTLAGITTFAGALVAPAVNTQLQQLGDRLPGLVERVESDLEQSAWGRWVISQIPEPAELAQAGKPLLESVPGVFRSTFGGVFNLFLIGIISLYLAIDASRYVDGCVSLFAAPLRPRVAMIFRKMGETARAWLLAQLLSMTVLGICTYIGLTILGIPLAMLLALITVVLTFIPNLGPVISVIPPFLLALAQNPWLALWVLVFYVVLQVMEGNFLTPMVMRKAIAMPPALLLSAQLLSATLLGFWGLVLAAPLTAVGMVALKEIHVKRMDCREEEKTAEDLPGPGEQGLIIEIPKQATVRKPSK